MSSPARSLSPSRLPSWKLEDAKAKFSQLVRQTRDGPQLVTVRGQDAVVVVSASDYARLVSSPKPKSLYEFFANSPLTRLESLGESLEAAELKVRDLPDF